MNALSTYTDELIARLEAILDRIQGTQAEWAPLRARWQARLDEMRAYAAANNQVSVAFVGGTGAGKSSLINALLGAELLPTHSFRACTSAAVSVQYAARKTCQATLHFLPEADWELEKQRFLEEVAEAATSGHSSFVHQDFLYKAWSLYRPRKGPPPMPFPLDELLELLRQPLPTSLQERLAQGSLVLREKTPQALSQELTRYLTAESPIWPLIRAVDIQGPFELLRDGLQLVDLPGLNDPNPAREAITRQYLQQAGFLWLIFGTGRGLTREVVEIMQDQSFISQIVLDGKVSALSFVGTRSDDFVPDQEAASLGLPPQSPLETIRQAREAQIELQLQQQLSELTLWFGNRYKVSDQSRDILQLIAATLQQSPLFLTSARAALALEGVSRAPSPFTEMGQTGLPRLRAHLHAIVAEHGIKARKKLIRSQFQQINQEIQRLLDSLRHRQRLHHLPEAASNALELELAQLSPEWRRQLTSLQSEVRQDLRLKRTQFEKHLLYAFRELPTRLEPLEDRWQALNWQVLKRAIAAGGRYSSPASGQQIDLGQDLLQLVESEVALDWYDFFQHRLLKEAEKAHSALASLLETAGQKVCAVYARQQPDMLPVLQRLCQEGEGILHEQAWRTRQDLAEQMRQLQQDLATQVAAGLQALLTPLLTEAATLSGSGVKQRQLTLLFTGLQQGFPDLGSQLESQLDTLLGRLSETLLAHISAWESLVQEQMAQLEQHADLEAQAYSA
ncbi:MAG: dynamin family protein [Candidatus Sericytochromatia bacterium]